MKLNSTSSASKAYLNYLAQKQKISGVAPHANLITYKACTAAGCLNAETTQAIDQATADGVDVINFSIGGGSRDAWSDSNAQAFLGARDAGVFASVAAGSSGPTTRTMGSPANAPWVTAVAATTHNRKFVNHLTGMSGGPADLTGAGVTSGYGPVAAGGAGGYVLANDQASGNSLIGDAFTLPGVAITYSDGLALKGWLATAGNHTASIAGATLDLSPANGDQASGTFDRGAGRVDLTKAALAGFVMNETAPNYLAADPSAGGDPTTLNEASIASSGCEATCTWTRTITSSIATGATWNVTTEKPKSMGLTVSPSRFTLAAGQSQKLTITADVSKLGVGQWAEGEIRLNGGLVAPAAHLPVEVFVGTATTARIVTNGTQGSQTIQLSSKVKITSFQSRVWGLMKGTVSHLLMTQDSAPLLPYNSVNTSVTLVDVPAGAKALGAAITAATSSDVDLYVGRDANGDTATGPAGTVNANVPFNVSLAWNEPKLGVGEAWFALVEYGSDKQHPTNAGSVLVQLNRVSG